MRITGRFSAVRAAMMTALLTVCVVGGAADRWTFTTRDDIGEHTRFAALPSVDGPASFWIASRDNVLPVPRNTPLFVVDLDRVLVVRFPDAPTIDEKTWYRSWNDSQKHALVNRSLVPAIAVLKAKSPDIPWEAIFEPPFRLPGNDWNAKLYLPLKVSVDGNPYPESVFSTSHPSGWAIFDRAPLTVAQESLLRQLTGYARPFAFPLSAYGGRSTIEGAQGVRVTYLDPDGRTREMAFASVERWQPTVPPDPGAPAADRTRWKRVRALPVDYPQAIEEAWLHSATSGDAQIRLSFCMPLSPDVDYWAPFRLNGAVWTLETAEVPDTRPGDAAGTVQAKISVRVSLTDGTTCAPVESWCALAAKKPFDPDDPGHSDGLFQTRRAMVVLGPATWDHEGRWMLLGRPLDEVSRVEVSYTCGGAARTATFTDVGSLAPLVARRPLPPVMPAPWEADYLVDPFYVGIRVDSRLAGRWTDRDADRDGMALHLLGPRVPGNGTPSSERLLIADDLVLDGGTLLELHAGEGSDGLSRLTGLGVAPTGKDWEIFIPVRVGYTLDGKQIDTGWYYARAAEPRRGGWFAPESAERAISSPLSRLTLEEASRVKDVAVSLVTAGDAPQAITCLFPALGDVASLARSLDDYGRALAGYFGSLTLR